MSLPIDPLLPEIDRHLAITGCLILEASPGAGKTTRVPLALMDAPWLAGQRILMLEPRRVAAKLAAGYMARQHGTPLGQVVGYQVRFERQVSADTRLELITDGLLSRRLAQDPELSGVGLVILDEFHERRLQSDLALAILKDIRDTLRPDLRILVMSATLDGERVARYLGDAPRLSSPGRLHPLDIQHVDGDFSPRQVAQLIRRALRETDGDVLAFLPGVGDIQRTARELDDCLVFPLYGEMSLADQERVLTPHSERRVILATNIAETSVTVPGVTAVVDSGWARQIRLDPSSGAERLETVRISQASATQRAGRAGRLGPGHVYRLWSLATHQALPEHDLPEITRVDGAPVVLELAEWGIKSGAGLLDSPPDSVWQTAVQQLVQWDALTLDGTITPLGRTLLRFPLHPRLAKLLWLTAEKGMPGLGADLAALLSERDLLTPEGAHSRHGTCDLRLRWKALQEAREHRFSNALRARGVDPQRARQVDQIARQLRHLIPGNRPDTPWDEETWSQLLLSVFPDRLAKRRPQQTGYLLRNGRGMRLNPASATAQAEWLLALQLDVGDTEGVIHWASPATADQIGHVLNDQLSRREVWRWDPQRETAVGVRQLAIGQLPLDEEQLDWSPEALELLLQAARKQPERAFNWTEAVVQWQRRVQLLHRLLPAWGFPACQLDDLLDSLREQAGSWRSFADLRQLDLVQVWGLDHATRQAVDRLAPTHWTLPSGRKVRLDYQLEGPPVLAAKLQDLFGVDATPTIAEGRQALLIHLLSPAGRPVQVTQDLNHFWRNSYQAVRRELRGRYPKHAWPEDPVGYVPPKR